MEENTVPEKPSYVTLALNMLFLSLGIGVIRVLVTWIRSGTPQPVESAFVTHFMMINMFHFRDALWVMHGHLLFVPTAVWLFYMIGTGKNWARMTLLIFVILDTLAIMLTLVFGLFLSRDHSSFSLLNFLISPSLLVPQAVLQIAAVMLLFGPASSEWFKAMKIWSQQARHKPSLE